MACGCKKEKIGPDSPCARCVEKHVARAWALVDEMGHLHENEGQILEDLAAAQSFARELPGGEAVVAQLECVRNVAAIGQLCEADACTIRGAAKLAGILCGHNDFRVVRAVGELAAAELHLRNGGADGMAEKIREARHLLQGGEEPDWVVVLRALVDFVGRY